MGLRQMFLNLGKEKRQDDLLVDDFVLDDDDPMLGWLADQQVETCRC